MNTFQFENHSCMLKYRKQRPTGKSSSILSPIQDITLACFITVFYLATNEIFLAFTYTEMYAKSIHVVKTERHGQMDLEEVSYSNDPF